MEIIPQEEGITIDFYCQFKVHLKDSHISTILACFGAILPQLLMDLFQKVLVGFGEYSRALKKSLSPANVAMMRILSGRHGMERKRVHPQNVWVPSGSGRSPRV